MRHSICFELFVSNESFPRNRTIHCCIYHFNFVNIELFCDNKPIYSCIDPFMVSLLKKRNKPVNKSILHLPFHNDCFESLVFCFPSYHFHCEKRHDNVANNSLLFTIYHFILFSQNSHFQFSVTSLYYGVASISWIDKIIGLFCKRAL